MIVAIIILAVAALVATVLLFRERSKRGADATRIALLEQEVAGLKAEKERRQEQLKAEEARFEAIANRVLLANSNNLAANHRQGLAAILEPMKRDLDAFRETFNNRMSTEEASRNFLGERVRELHEANMTVSRETRRLTDALKGNNKFQGDWGEMILENILQAAGLRKGEEYTVQESAVSEGGSRLRPDVVINYTDSRKLVIDSKASMTDYLRMVSADDDQLRTQFGKAHVNSVRRHIQELRQKSYQDLGGRENVDFVLMFIPHEGAYLAALDLDRNLWQEAYESRVLLISPTHLMAVVQLVGQMWRKTRQDRNAVEIAERTTDMLNRFTAFLDKMDQINGALNRAQKAYDEASNALSNPRQGLIAKARRITDLGIKLRRQLPEAEE